MSPAQHRYNVSEKGRARYARYREAHRDEIRERNLAYWHRIGGGLYHRREREIADLRRKIDALVAEHPEFAWMVGP